VFVIYTVIYVIISYSLYDLHAYLYLFYHLMMLFTCICVLFVLLVGEIYMVKLFVLFYMCFYDIYMLVGVMFITV